MYHVTCVQHIHVIHVSENIIQMSISLFIPVLLKIKAKRIIHKVETKGKTKLNITKDIL